MTAFPLILSAPSGAGKTSIARELLSRRSDVGYSISCTTRAPRAGEREGEHYFFLSSEEFARRKSGGSFAECAVVHGNWYGTLRSEVEGVLDRGRHVLMDIDVQGAAQFRKAFPASVAVFVLPPSADVLLERLRARGTEDRKALGRRMISALEELDAVGDYEYVVVNDVMDDAVARVSAILDAEASKRERMSGLNETIRSMVTRIRAEIDDTHNED